MLRTKGVDEIMLWERPYFNYTSLDLEEEVKKSWRDLAELNKIWKELEYRSRGRALRLKDKVRIRLKELQL
jgi:hypothetical protein